MPRAARALRYGFKSLSMKNPSSAMKALIHDGGTAGSTPDHFASDLGFFDDSLPFETRSNRAPGVCQLSSRWSFALHSHPNPTKRREFKQLLSQVNWYMRQHHTRYGFILTDREFVAIRRLDGPGKGHLELSDPVSWEASGTVSDPRLTILLGLWYLGMLAADEENFRLMCSCGF
ncbi:hypothetical protein BO82DRAFT_352968 [Aspergillus uvarum CBS 121591]|uniref:Fungal-type protein kinase domain-containing protein n=1 Tax=Aspergillus uvarum CBS 121591 TaxID=1448315 RepID=A0A319CDI6_9EURO|nr:hypothetical protein BO82DRAFT_352968 [Aspergillus uvarum CBS 121591]PYH83244.1 hypothetical protein BO82DRAFT_352968 [Aspergillus uvarum CBS 121591]